MTGDTDRSRLSETTEPAQAQAAAAAFLFGWRMAELYNQPHLPPPAATDPAAQLPPHLPGASEMSAHDRAHLSLDQAESALRQLATSLDAELPTLDAVARTLNSERHNRDDVRHEALVAYIAIRNGVAGLSPLAATSCGLGRVLADTTLLPHSSGPAILLERFEPHRLDNTYRWLDDLSTSLPRDVASAVKASLATWEAWITALPKQDETLQPSAFTPLHVRRLRAQGDMWRRLVAGEITPRGLLNSNDYVEAGEQLLRQARRIAARFLLRWWFPAAVLVAATAAAIWAAVTYAPSGSSRVAAILVSLAGALGLSWKAVAATLGRALAKAESALWDSEVLASIGRAATVHPERERPSSRPDT